MATKARKKFNRIQVLYYGEEKPYLHGHIRIIDKNLNLRTKTGRFVISKRLPNKEEVVYGTVKRILDKILFQINKLKKFGLEAQEELENAGIVPIVQDGSNVTLPESEITDNIIMEQENLIEDILLIISVNIRILSELFPGKLNKSEVDVYNYDDKPIDKIKLNEIANLLVHNRYILIKNDYIVDIISDQKFMTETPQMELKINFLEYVSEVEKVVNNITVKDLITILWNLTEKLSVSSEIKDIIFLIQNLYTLGGSVLGKDTLIDEGPVKIIFDRMVKNRGPGPHTLFHSTPRFVLEPNLDQKQICTRITVSGNKEKLVMDYEEFFREILKGSGNRKLL